MWSKYIKPLHLHVANQKHAHVIFGFTTKEDANKVTVTTSDIMPWSVKLQNTHVHAVPQITGLTYAHPQTAP